MFTLNKKQKMLITSTMALAIVCIIAFPYAYASSTSTVTGDTQSSRIRLLRAKGIALERSAGQVVINSAGFTLSLEAVEINETVIRFNVVGGTVEVNGTEYAIAEGNGAVIRDKHGFLLEAQGTNLEGQTATLKLAGRYFWMWGRLHIARLLGSLQTESGKTLLLLRSVIRV